MSVNGVIPNVKASGDIYPLRLVKPSGVMLGAAATAGTDAILGISDGSTLSSSSALNAASGTQINMQAPFYFQVETGAAVTVNAYLMPTTAGKAITLAGAGCYSGIISMETSAADGDIVWCRWVLNTKTIAF